VVLVSVQGSLDSQLTRNICGTRFCSRLIQPEDNSEAGTIKSNEIFHQDLN
jgi:hypothetical protein